MLGRLAAQSVEESATQMTLNTFHLAGVSSTITLGVPRLNEKINATKNMKTPSMIIPLKKEFSKYATTAREVQYIIEYLQLKNICEVVKIIYDPDIKTTVIEEDKNGGRILWNARWRNWFWSIFLGRFIIRIEISRAALISRNLSLEFISDKIKSLYEWMLQTYGVSTNTRFPIYRRNVAYCNNLNVIYETLGVEATRQCILNELGFVIEANGSYVNYRHMSLLADVMKINGILRVTRNGISKESEGALKRSSFEHTVNILLDAAVNSELDVSKGITENIMMGQISATWNWKYRVDIRN